LPHLAVPLTVVGEDQATLAGSACFSAR